MQITEILKYVEENIHSAFFYTPNIHHSGKSYFFKNPYKILKGKTKTEVEEILAQIDEISQDPNFIGFGIFPYEIGYYFQPKEIKKTYLNKTTLSFLFYKKEDVEIINSDEIKFNDAEEYFKLTSGIKNLKLDIDKNEYVKKIDKIKKYITEGETYQINFTTKAKFKFEGELLSLFLNGIFNQSAGYSAFINDENNYILSFTPELFFKTDYRTIKSKPMKGTLKRKGNPFEDKKLGASLSYDEKNLAENVMIVDLIRNDIGRIAVTDTVKVEKIYEVEKYETLYQLTSTVTGKLKENKLSEIFKNLFPSGSITGAPKIRSMQIIAELEKSQRNLYTGSIGIITNKNAVFNISIRTILINKKTKNSELGLGSGIVWDSDAEKEYEEVLLKGKFITASPKYFELLESILFEDGKYFLLEYHLKRLKNSSEYFLFKFPEEKIRVELEKIKDNFNKNKKYKIRLLLNKWGNIKINYQVISSTITNVKVLISKKKRCDESKFLYHKTTYRPWDRELVKAKKYGFDEVLFINDNHELLEGAITNLIIENNNKLFTPPTDFEILNGCYRQYLLDQNLCNEKYLILQDLKTADKVYLCNSIKRKIIVNEIWDEEKGIVYKYNE